MPRYFLDLPEHARPTRWEPSLGTRPERRDTRYWSQVFVRMEETLCDGDIDVYLTFDSRRLPAYGERVVAVLLGDEVGRIPRYADRVRAVFKSYGTHPWLGSGPLRNPGLTGLSEAAQSAVRWLRWTPGGMTHSLRRADRAIRGGVASPPVAAVPLGTFNQLELPILPVAERRNDIFFAGSVEHRSSLQHHIGSPKVRTRREMLSAVEHLAQARPSLQIEVRLTRDFSDSEAASDHEYSNGLMNSRVCLAPRGTSVETFRLLEGLRYGCVVVSERLPDHWFYKGGPFIQLNRWSDLPSALLPIFHDPDALRRAHLQSIGWWRERCSEAAVGRFIAERLNGYAGGAG